MNEIDDQTAVELLRTLPGQRRVLRQIMGGEGGLRFQFDSGIELEWSARSDEIEVVAVDDESPPSWRWSLRINERLRDAWRGV